MMDISQIDGNAWFIGQPLVEDGIVSKQVYLELVEIFIKILYKIMDRS